MENDAFTGIRVVNSTTTNIDILLGGKIGIAKFNGHYLNEHDDVFGIKMV